MNPIVIGILILIGWMILTRPALKPAPQIMLPPPALPPGGSWYSRQPGENCSPADQKAKRACQQRYNSCIDESLQGRAHFPDCHDEYEQNCLPVIRRCQ